MRALRQLAGERRLLLVGDSKLVSYANLRDIMAAEVDFIAPASKTYVPAEVLAALDPAAATPVDYLAERDQHKPPDQRGSYRVVEDTMTITGKRTTDPVLSVRRVVVWSSARADAASPPGPRSWSEPATTSSGSPGAWAAATTPTPKRSPPGWPPSAAAAGSPACCAPRSAPTRPLANQPWRGGSTRRAGRRGRHRRLVCVADQPGLRPGQHRRGAGPLQGPRGGRAPLRAFKGPLAVAPLFVQSNRRIQALVTVICLALLVFCLVERQVRRAIAPDRTLQGLYLGQPAKPTGRLIFEALARLRLIPASGHDPPIIPRPPPLQARLLELLDVDPTQLS
jgi:hypothetical protein